ncbi:hypothetical protein J2T56_000300 [Natronobacillus azotifigens]|uniref:Arsenite efflux transporter metallochaperone ArsD n=1 Tax=Natronobacillus azotifigens TaxID=472978 RepID=A0A9J6R8G7_9BACI|nr:arsenite efflux transporter metallochaperone ArsD [Natronobacillus azotifigens]MCZ0701925.1 arsenite efflux transporter metallochaperone ArsD [Natronobacillus azotifigens]
MKKVEIFDPAMCCSTGVCGPSVDPELTRVAAAVHSLEKKGENIQRYQLTNDPEKFAENEEVTKILTEKGPDALPIVLVDDQVKTIGTYPTNEDFSAWFHVSEQELKTKPTSRRTIDLNTLS